MEIRYREIGKRVRDARIAKGLSQERLAELVGVGTTHISHIETGNTIASMKIFVALVDVLGVSADRLLCDSLANAKEAYLGELAEELKDCSVEETRFIVGLIPAVKQSLRRYHPPK